MTSGQLQNAFGFTKSSVNRKIREGMSTDSVEAAREWLEKNAKRKVGSHLKASPTVLPVEGTSTLEDAVRALQANERGVSARINEITTELLKTVDNDEKKRLANQLSDLRAEQKQFVTALSKSEKRLS
jgi:hypothetical protein